MNRKSMSGWVILNDVTRSLRGEDLRMSVCFCFLNPKKEMYSYNVL